MKLVYSIADQDFARTKSLGIFNLSMGLLRATWEQPGIDELHVLAHPDHDAFLADAPPHVHVHNHSSPQQSKLRRLVWDQFGVTHQTKALGLQGSTQGDRWLMLPKGFTPLLSRNIAKPTGYKVATYVHDVMPEYYHRVYPKASGRREMTYFLRGLYSAIRQSDAIFTNSEFSANEIRRVAAARKIPCPPVHPIGIGFDIASDPLFSAPPVPTEQREGVVALASTHPHKRADLAVAYLNRFQQAHGTKVDWIGGFTEAQLASETPLGNRLPRLAHDEFGARLARAKAVVYFSEYEGFGMPPVEAILLGTCSVYPDLPVTREVMQGGGQAFDLHDYESFDSALQAAMKTPAASIAMWREALLKRHHYPRVAREFVGGLSSLSSSNGCRLTP